MSVKEFLNATPPHPIADDTSSRARHRLLRSLGGLVMCGGVSLIANARPMPPGNATSSPKAPAHAASKVASKPQANAPITRVTTKNGATANGRAGAITDTRTIPKSDGRAGSKADPRSGAKSLPPAIRPQPLANGKFKFTLTPPSSKVQLLKASLAAPVRAHPSSQEAATRSLPVERRTHRAAPTDSEQLAALWIPETATTSVPTTSGRPLNLTTPSTRLVADSMVQRNGAGTGGASGGSSPPPIGNIDAQSAGPAGTGFAQMQGLARTAAERSATIRDALATLRASALDVREASGARWPQLNVDVTSRYTSGAGDTQSSAARGAPYYSLSGTMPVFDWGRISQVVESRTANQRAAGARLDTALESLSLDTAIAALELGRYRTAVATVDTYLRNVQRLVNMLVDITREDPGRSGELTQARSRVLQAQVNRDALVGKVREAEIALDRLVGNHDQPIDALVAAFDRVPALESLLADLPAQPGLRQLEAERQSQDSLAKSLASARLPQVNAVVSRAPVAPGVVSGYGSYAGLTVSLPLFRGFSDVSAQHAAEERAIGAGERRQQGETDLNARIRTLHESATSQLSRVPEFVSLLRESDQVRRGFFEQWYQMGRRSLFELLAAESEHYSLQAAHLNTLYDGLETCARLRGEAGALASWLGMRSPERVAPGNATTAPTQAKVSGPDAAPNQGSGLMPSAPQNQAQLLTQSPTQSPTPTQVADQAANQAVSQTTTQQSRRGRK